VPLKKGYHQRVAERLESLDQNKKSPPVNDLAYHFTQAGNRAKSIQYHLAAGEDALSRFSNSEAIDHFTYVIENIDDIPENRNIQVAATERLGDAFSAAGKLDRAIRTYEDFEKVVQDSVAKLRALRKIVMCSYWRGDNKLAIESAAKAKEFVQSDPIEYSRLRLYKGFVSGRSFGDTTEAIADMTESLSVFEEKNLLPDVARALVELSFAYPWNDRLEDALSAALRSVAIYEELDNPSDTSFAIGRLGTALGSCGFLREALEAYGRAMKIGEKIGDYNNLSFLYMMSGLFLEQLGDLNAAIAESLKGVAAAEKTDAAYAKSLCYINLVREYCKFGQVELADKFYQLLQKLLADNVALKNNSNTAMQVESVEAFLLLYKGDRLRAMWKAQQVEKYHEGRMRQYSIHNSLVLAAAFEKMGQTEKAKEQREIADRLHKSLLLRFEHSNVQAFMILPREANSDDQLEVRIDFVNAGKNLAKLVKIEELLPTGAKLLDGPCYVNSASSTLLLSQTELNGLQVETAKIKIVLTKPGEFVIKPNLIYISDLGQNQTYNMNSVKLKIKPKPISKELQTRIGMKVDLKVEFKSVAAENIFDYLVKSFKNDYLQRMPKEKSGWRTLMDMVREGKISKHSVYDSAGRHGSAIAELERNKMVEVRVFEGERGRGGKILKVRIAVDKEAIRKEIENREKISIY
jgi:tetratricopeptide (TPR) repeat protein